MIIAYGLDGKKRTYNDYSSKGINWALGHAGNVVLEAGKTYIIKDSLLFQDHTDFIGNGSILKLAKGLPIWGGPKVSISQEKAMLMVKGNSAQDIALSGFTVDGSQSDFYSKIKLGTSCYNMATLIGCNGLTINDCTFRNGCNDAILLSKCSNINIENLTVDKCGHDGIYVYRCSDVNVSNSNFINRTNSSCRFYNLTGGSFINNSSSTSGGGFCGLELQGNVKNVDVKNNYFRGLPYPAIVGLNTSLSNVSIENNTIVKCKSPGISVVGAYLKNNVIK